jgi:hypothetical protein
MARQKSIWKTEKYTASNGKEYQRYVLDEAGNKVLRDDVDPTTVDPEQLKPAAKAAKPDPKRVRKVARKHTKRIVPDHIVESMRNATSLRAPYFDGNDCYVVIVDEKHVNERDSGWMIVRISKTKSDKMVFFNLRTREWKPFDVATDKPGRGNSAIIWPAMPAEIAKENAERELERLANPETDTEEMSYYMRKKLGLVKRAS